MLNSTQLLEIEGRLQRTSPGPWKSYIEGRDHSSGCSFIMVGVGDSRGPDIELSGATIDDQDFIASAKQDVRILLDEIYRLRSVSEG